MSHTDEARQRAFYHSTAASYYESHVGEQDEHGLSAGAGVGNQTGGRVAPSGRNPDRDLQQRSARGGCAAAAFAEDSFDWVVKAVVLHHIRHWSQAVAEMALVPRLGMLISYASNIGQCNWNPALWPLTKGKLSKWSEGDGLSDSFCALGALLLLHGKFVQVQVIDIQGSREEHLRSAVTPVAIVSCWQPV